MNHLIHSPHFKVEETEAQVTHSQSHRGVGVTRINIFCGHQALNMDFTF